MFILAPKATTLWPVIYRTPNDEGAFDEHTFKVRFNLPQNQDEVEEVLRRVDDARQRFLQGLLKGKAVATPEQEDEALELGAVDRWILDKFWAGWPDGELKDASGAVIAYSDEARQLLLRMPGMRIALVRAFMDTLGGNAETKNSKPLRTTG
jgi:hypothetical protein